MTPVSHGRLAPPTDRHSSDFPLAQPLTGRG
jgi:hypothetical protein